MPAERITTTSSKAKENRKNSKPAMERRRRQRINQSLSELKSMILGSMKPSECPRHASKLEKADILELTVRHLQNLHKNLSSPTPMTDSESFHAGFSACSTAASRFLVHSQSQDPVAAQLFSHLNSNKSRSLPKPNVPDHGRIIFSPRPNCLERQSPAESPSEIPQVFSYSRHPSFDVYYMTEQQSRRSAQSESPSPDQFFDRQPIDFSVSSKNSSTGSQFSRSASSTPESHCSDAENVWRPW